MSLVSKLKTILFEEEEVEIPVIEKKTTTTKEYKEMPIKEEIKKPNQPEYNNFYKELAPAIEETRRLEEKRLEEKRNEEKMKYQPEFSKRENYRSDRSFTFPDFDEEEFKNIVPKQRTTNVLDYERKMQEKRVEYKKVEKERFERKEEPKTKFKPSPIISPVYGILDKNYTPDDITSRTEVVRKKTLDVDSVRKKAFGSFEEPQKAKVLKTEKELDDKILEEKLEKARTIDELLKDSSDEVIEIKKDVQINKAYVEEIDSLEDIAPLEKTKNTIDEDTLESDLFDLIDSMYENREDGE